MSKRTVTYLREDKMPEWATPQALKDLHDRGKSLRQLAEMCKVSYEKIRLEILKAKVS